MIGGDFASAVRGGILSIETFVVLGLRIVSGSLRGYYIFLSSAFFVFLGGCVSTGGSGGSGGSSLALQDLVLDLGAGLRVGSELRASLDDFSDVEFGSVSYQWLRGGIEISGADSFSYILSSLDIGLGLSVRIRYRDDFGEREVVSDLVMASDTEGNVSIDVSSGVVGDDLRIDFSDPDNAVDVVYQWFRDGVVIREATGSTYRLTSADSGSVVSAGVSYSDGFGRSIILSFDDVMTEDTAGSVEVRGSGGFGVGDDLVLEFVDVDLTFEQLGRVVYQWLRDGVDIVGAMDSTYTIMLEDIGNEVSVRASYSDSFGKHEISGDGVRLSDTLGRLDFSPRDAARVGIIFEVMLYDEDIGPGVVQADSYEWLRDGVVIAGETLSTYTISSADSGFGLSVRAIYSDWFGSYTLTSDIVNTVDTEGTISIDDSIDFRVGDDLVLDFVDVDLTSEQLGRVGYQWLRDGDEITDETGSTYTLTPDDVGKDVGVRAIYDDGFGEIMISSGGIYLSDSVGRLDLFLRDSARVGIALEAMLYDADIGFGVLQAGIYEWLRDGVVIAGATLSTYTISSADSGFGLSVRALYSDSFGSYTLTSGIFDTVDTGGTISIDGSDDDSVEFRVGDDLVLDFVDVDLTFEQLGRVGYQWLRDGVEITDETMSTYTLTPDDVGKDVSVRAIYDDGFGESMISSGGVNLSDSVGRLDLFLRDSARVGIALEAMLYDADIGSGIIDAGIYEWLRDGVVIAGATMPSYTISSADSGFGLSVRVIYEDGFGSYTLTSGIFDTVDTGGTISIDGFGDADVEFRVGDDLVLDFVDVDLTSEQLGRVGYQWLRDGEEIAGATGSTYTLTPEDSGKEVGVSAIYDDGFGELEIFSEWVNLSDSVGRLDLFLRDSARVGIVLEAMLYDADVGSGIIDADSYEWLRDGVVIAGATLSTYTISSADSGFGLSVRAIYDDGFGSYTLTSGIFDTVDTGGTISIDGSGDASIEFRVGDDVSLDFVDVDLTFEQLGRVGYQWLRDGDEIAGATGSTYRLGSADSGNEVGVRAIYDDGFGETMISSGGVNLSDSVGRLDLFLRDSARVGIVLESMLYDADVGSGVVQADSYEWLRDGFVIAGATLPTYTISSADSGFGLSVRAIYEDGFGSYTLTSGIFDTVDTGGTISIDGSGDASVEFRVGDDLVLDFVDVDLTFEQLGRVGYQWLRDGDEIADETMFTYTLTPEDVGKDVSVRAIYSDVFGDYMIDSSAITVELALVDTEGRLDFCSSLSDFSRKAGHVWMVCVYDDDIVGMITDDVSYRWFRDGDDIGVSTNSYVLTAADAAANVIRVEATYSDIFGVHTVMVSDPPVSFPSPAVDSFSWFGAFDSGDLF